MTNQTSSSIYQDYPVVMEVSVRWGEQDMFKHLNNVIYFRYFESARVLLLEKAGMDEALEGLESKNAPILAETACRYRRPVTYPDNILVATRIHEVLEFGFTQDYVIFSQNQQCVTTLATSRITMVNNKSGKKMALHPEERRILEDLKNGKSAS